MRYMLRVHRNVFPSSKNPLNAMIFSLLFLLSFWQPRVLACLQLTENGQPVLFCQSSVPRLPLTAQDIPAKVSKLRILGISSPGEHNGVLSQYNLTGLETLTYLEMSNFNLERIEADTFRFMRQLRVLDLSKNRIHTIQPGAFRGLVLNLLSLSDNTGLDGLKRGVFQAAQIYHLAARNCGLRQLDYATIAEAKPVQLSVSHNRITWLDPRFAKILKPWSSSPSSGPTSPHTSVHRPTSWGYIDLTDNPLNCNCQLVWLPRLIEEQLYHAQRLDVFPKTPDLSSSNSHPDGFSNTSVKLMYQLNLTCASPTQLAGKLLPRSSDFFCPMPKVVAIDINLFQPHLEQAQITCVGQGQPPPSLAWTYRNNGQKVQRILDPVAHLPPFMTSRLTSVEANTLSERRLALNISLEEPQAKSFTCTVWNDDRVPLDTDDDEFGHSSDRIDRYKSSSLSVPTGEFIDHSAFVHRIHEVTVRVSGPKPTGAEATVDEHLPSFLSSTSVPFPSVRNQTATGFLFPVTESLGQKERIPSAYEYLFTERFSLLQLLGAVIGTFVVTLALLYLSTHLLSFVCPVSQFPVKEFPRTAPARATKHKWLTWLRHQQRWRRDDTTPASTRTGLQSNSSTERTPLNECSLMKAANCDSAFSMLNSTPTGLNSLTGPSTVAIRGQSTLPQALLMTSVPVPRLDRSSTPPPNPVYWPMPEYTYTGTGSHEYDVPQPFDSIGLGNRTMFRPGLSDTNPMNSPLVAQSFISLNANSAAMPMSSGTMTDNRMHPSAPIYPAASTIPSHWSQTAKPGMALLNPLINWTPALVNGTSMGLTSQPEERQLLVNCNYTQYPSGHSAIYSADYPTYLQTRPYPHHQHQVRPLLELATTTSGNMRFSPATKPSSSSSASTEPTPNTPETFMQRTSLQHSGTHSAETNLSAHDSDP